MSCLAGEVNFLESEAFAGEVLVLGKISFLILRLRYGPRISSLL